MRQIAGEAASTETSRPHPPFPQPRGSSSITWIISGAALIVTAAAGALFLSPSPQAGESVQAELGSTPSELTSPPQDPQTAAELPISKHPLNITASFLDAQERARIWHDSAMLAGLSVTVIDAAPKGPIVFEFGIPEGRAIVGAPLGARRLTLFYESSNVQRAEGMSRSVTTALPAPNCPLDVAFRQLNAKKKGGVSTQAADFKQFAAKYTHSKRHNRPIWLITTAEGKSQSINADNCALLRR